MKKSFTVDHTVLQLHGETKKNGCLSSDKCSSVFGDLPQFGRIIKQTNNTCNKRCDKKHYVSIGKYTFLHSGQFTGG